MRRESFQFRVNVGRQPAGRRGLEQALRDQIGEPAVGRRRVRVVFDRETEMACARLTGRLERPPRRAADDAGLYSVTVGNRQGFVPTVAAALALGAGSSQLTNLSVRGRVEEGGSTLIAGFISTTATLADGVALVEIYELP